MREQLNEKVIELYKELNHEDGSSTKAIFFDSVSELTYGLKFIYDFSCPILLICRGGGGESHCITVEEDTKSNIVACINTFLNNNKIEIKEILI